MRTPLAILTASLLAAASCLARNPEPLRFRGSHHPPANPIMRVVLVHGFLENGRTYRTMRKRLEQKGIECLVPKLSPCDGRGGLEALAEQLKKDIDAAYGTEQAISIVAFSMGGVISRQYLQNLGGAPRCEKLITISSPHQGTQAAWIYPSQGAAEMRPGSAFLKQLESTESRLGNMTVVSCRTPLDLVILPSSNSVWERAENLKYPVLLHPLMLTSDAVITDIEKRLLD